MTEAPPIVVENLSFRYRTRTELAIQDISLTVHPGEMILVAGASGCGKTTLARCINGLIPRSYKGELQGSVYLYGRPVSEMTLAEIAQVVGTLLQDPERQIVASQVFHEVAFGPENLGLPREEILERVDEALHRLGIEHLRERETFNLSGGEKQKVALAGVLAMRPTVLLLDEPLASLDPASAHEALALFRRLADEGTTIVLVEHRVEDALAARPDRLLYIEDAQVRYLGPIDHLPPEVDPAQVKLPAAWVVKYMRQQGKVTPPPPVAEHDGEPLVVFEDVDYAYGDGPLVLKGVNLTIRRGDLLAVLGPNGAGKSTLVKHTIGLLKPTRGRVLVEGKDTRDMSVAQVASTVGYVFQSPSHMLFAPTVLEELAFGPENLGFDAEETAQAIRESVQVVNMQGMEEYSPLGLSFGQQKRTAIAAVLAMRSRILILDEPTAGQDYANYTRFMNTLCRATDGRGQSLLSSRFAATLFITHDLDLALTYANRVVLVSEGRIVADGRPEDVLQDFDLLERCRVRPTSLLRMNCEFLPKTGRFLPVEALAAYAA